MTADPWEAATYVGAERSLRERVATWTPQERLDWLDAVVADAAESGLLDELRHRKQSELLEAWEATDPDRVS